MAIDPNMLARGLSKAVGQFWRARDLQAKAQRLRGALDQGARGAVTGGAQMSGFVELIAGIVRGAGMSRADLYVEAKLELPGYFRPTKKWDLLIVSGGKLVAVIEAKSQIGPSFGNNFNNRAEEAIGSAVDLWTAYREKAFGGDLRPWLGYLFLLEDCAASRAPVKAQEPHFPVFPEFRDASYARRYELLCRKLILERHYEAAALLLSDRVGGRRGQCTQPWDDLGFVRFAASLAGHAAAFVAAREGPAHA